MQQAGGPGGGAAAPPDFGRSEGAAGQRRRAALLPAPPDFWPLVHPWVDVGQLKLLQLKKVRFFSINSMQF